MLIRVQEREFQLYQEAVEGGDTAVLLSLGFATVFEEGWINI